jgi:PPOX class probable F420-dependent enzyme
MKKRTQISMTPDEVVAYLREQRTLNVATLGPNGEIHIVAMWFFMDGAEPMFWTYAKSQKARNLERNPQMSALVESGDVYAQLRGVELIGRGELITDPARVLEIHSGLTAKYHPSENRDPEAGGASKRVGVRMQVDRVISWDHSKLNGAH